MSVSESERSDLFGGLTEVIGEPNAEVLMSLLPPAPVGALATRADMHAETVMLRGEMAETRADLRIEMAELRTELRGEMAELRFELQGEMTELRTDLRGAMAELRSELQGEMVDLRTAVSAQINRGMITTMVSGFVVNASLMVALVLLVWRLSG